jgi:hypothetical protein
MSHKWTGNAVGRISKQSMDEVVELMQSFPWLISHDNVQIPFRVFSQRCVAVSWLLPLRFPVQTNTNRESQLFEEG